MPHLLLIPPINQTQSEGNNLQGAQSKQWQRMQWREVGKQKLSYPLLGNLAK